MSLACAAFKKTSPLDHFLLIDDPREASRVAHPLCEVLLLTAVSHPVV